MKTWPITLYLIRLFISTLPDNGLPQGNVAAEELNNEDIDDDFLDHDEHWEYG